MTQRISFRRPGGPEVLEWTQAPEVPLLPGHARVRNEAIGVDFIDCYHRSGLYPVPSLPSGLGMEGAGVITAWGDGPQPFPVGTRVAYLLASPGAYAEEVVVQASRLIPLPDAVTPQQAAALLLKGMTVEYLIFRCAPVTAGQTVLWHAAAGGVGLLACQWLRALGVRVIGTVGSAAKAELALAAGCSEVIRYDEGPFAPRVRELTDGAGVPIVFDSVGKSTQAGSLECLARRGIWVTFGNASGPPDPVSPAELGRRGSLFVTRPALGDYTATEEELQESAGRVFAALAAGTLQGEAQQQWPLREAAAAHLSLEGRRTVGSTVLIP